MAVVIHRFFLPAVFAGIALGAASRVVPRGGARTALQVVAALLFSLPQLFVLFIGNRTTLLVLHRNAVMALWLVLGGAVGVWVSLRRPLGAPGLAAGAQSRRAPSPVLTGIAGLLVGAGGLWLASQAAKDAVLPHRVIEGTVTRAWITHGRGGPYWHIAVNGRPLDVTEDVYTALRPGVEVRVEAGAGSGTVLAVRRRSP